MEPKWESNPLKYSAKQARERYRNDPSFRSRKIAQYKRRDQRLKGNYTYDRLKYITKKIWNKRNSIDIFLNRIETLEKELIVLIKQKEKLQKKFKEERKNGKY